MKLLIQGIVRRTVVIIFILTPLLFFCLGSFMLYEYYHIRLKGIQTEGQIIRYFSPESGADSVFYPVIRFKTKNGEEWTAVSRYGWPQKSSDTHIHILYLENNPDTIYIHTNNAQLAGWSTLILGVCGLM